MNDNKVVDLKTVKTAKMAKNKGSKCPMCAKPTVVEYKPFCSKRCADLDLGRWLSDGYRVPTDEVAGAGDDTGYDED